MNKITLLVAVICPVALASLGVVSCANLGASNVAQTMEITETGAESAYVALVTGIKADEAANPSHTTADNVLWNQAWTDLQNVRGLYLKGQSIDAAVGALMALKIPAPAPAPNAATNSPN